MGHIWVSVKVTDEIEKKKINNNSSKKCINYTDAYKDFHNDNVKK